MAFGLRPYRHISGGVIRFNEYKIASGYATDLYRGDPVRLLTTGYIARSGATDTDVLGPFMGAMYTATDGSVVFSQHWPASTTTLGSADVTAWVSDDPNVEYLIEASEAATFAAVGGSADMVINAGNATTKLSGVTLNAGAIVTSTAQLRILGKEEVPDNNWGDSDVILRVRINEHAFVTGTAGI